jgi:integrase
MSATSKPTPGITPLGDNKFKVRVYDPRDGRQLVVTVAGIAEARRTHARFKAEVQKVGRTPRHGRAPVVREFGESWRPQLRHAPGTASGLEQVLRLHIYPELGDLRVDRVTHRDALGFVRRLSVSTMAVSTMGTIDTTARFLFAAIVAEGWLEISPFAKVKRIEVSRRDARRQDEYVPSVGEALFLADLALEEGRVDMWAMVRLLVGTGLRGGEAVGLSVEELNYPAPIWVTVAQQLQYTSDGFYLAPPKSVAGERRIPLATWVADALAVTSAERAPYAVRLPWVERGAVRGERSAELIFSGRYGPAPIQETVIARAVRALATKAGMPGRVTPHSLRRTYTTMLGDAGVPLRVIDYVTGHESSGLTLGVYSEVTAAGLAKARTATEEALTAARGPSREGLLRSRSARQGRQGLG